MKTWLTFACLKTVVAIKEKEEANAFCKQINLGFGHNTSSKIFLALDVVHTILANSLHSLVREGKVIDIFLVF